VRDYPSFAENINSRNIAIVVIFVVAGCIVKMIVKAIFADIEMLARN